MKDSDLRDAILTKFYEIRHQQPGLVNVLALPGVESLESEEERLVNICEQLAEKGLIKWKSLNSQTRAGGMGRITARGVDSIERAGAQAGELINQWEDNRLNPSKKVFIGHGRSPARLQLKGFLEDLCLVWNEFSTDSVAGITTTERLDTLLKDSGFAFLVMTAEDGHADGTTHARENVIHETGLFQGKLGFRRAIILLEEGCAQFSNIHGLTYIGFPKKNLTPAFEEMRRVLEREQMVGSVSLHQSQTPPENLDELSIGLSFEKFHSEGPGDNCNACLWLRFHNHGTLALFISRCVYWNAHGVPLIADALRSQKYPDAYEVKFGEHWKEMSILLAPQKEEHSYLPLSAFPAENDFPQGRRGRLLIEYTYAGRTGQHRASLWTMAASEASHAGAGRQ